MEFKNYKEKQQFYKNRCKQKNTIWVSKDVLNDFTKKNSIIKGMTYIKPKESEVNDNDSN